MKILKFRIKIKNFVHYLFYSFSLLKHHLHHKMAHYSKIKSNYCTKYQMYLLNFVSNLLPSKWKCLMRIKMLKYFLKWCKLVWHQELEVRNPLLLNKLTNLRLSFWFNPFMLSKSDWTYHRILYNQFKKRAERLYNF